MMEVELTCWNDKLKPRVEQTCDLETNWYGKNLLLTAG